MEHVKKYGIPAAVALAAIYLLNSTSPDTAKKFGLTGVQK
jgi:hypothetical protein